MNTAITTIEGLEQWFRANKRPFFTLFLHGNGEKVVLRNTDVDDVDAAWDMMRTHVLIQAQGGLANLRVYATDKANSNNGVTTWVRIAGFGFGGAPGMPGIAGMMPGSASMPGIFGVGTKEQIDAYVAEKLAAEKANWKLEKRIDDLEREQKEGQGFGEKVLETFANTPHLAGSLEKLIDRVADMLAPKPRPVLAVTGFPPGDSVAAPAAAVSDRPVLDDDDDEFEKACQKEMETLCSAANMDELEVLKKINELRTKNPGVFKMLLAQ